MVAYDRPHPSKEFVVPGNESRKYQKIRNYLVAKKTANSEQDSTCDQLGRVGEVPRSVSLSFCSVTWVTVLLPTPYTCYPDNRHSSDVEGVSLSVTQQRRPAPCHS